MRPPPGKMLPQSLLTSPPQWRMPARATSSTAVAAECGETPCNLTTRESPFVSKRPKGFLGFSLRAGSPALGTATSVPSADIQLGDPNRVPLATHLGAFQASAPPAADRSNAGP